MPSSQPSRAPSEASTASSNGRERVEQLAQRCHEPDADVEDVVAFFEAIRLQKYVPMLRERDVDGPLLLELVKPEGKESLMELVPSILDATMVRSKLKPRKQPANYDLIKILGRGATGLTVLAVDKKTGQRVAIKRVEVDDDSQVSASDASECV